LTGELISKLHHWVARQSKHREYSNRRPARSCCPRTHGGSPGAAARNLDRRPRPPAAGVRTKRPARVEGSIHLENRERAMAWPRPRQASGDKRLATGRGSGAASACPCALLRLRQRAHGCSHCRAPVAGARVLAEPERRAAHPALHPAPAGHELTPREAGGMAKEATSSRCAASFSQGKDRGTD